jgi:alpha-L-fucosidase
MRDALAHLLGDDLAAGQKVSWRPAGSSSWVAELDLGRTTPVGITDLREDIEKGQVVARYRVEGSVGGAWQVLSRGTTIGYRKLDRFTALPVRRVRVTIEAAVDHPRPLQVLLYAGG